MTETASRSVSRCPSPSKKSITIETRTSSKTLSIKWVINKETLDIAKLSPQKNKKGVIATTMQYGAHTLNFELCLTGWKRSHRDHSAFYFTVPKEDHHYFHDEEFKEPPRDFVAKYSISFENGKSVIIRNSSIREDFDLGVGFPNFTEQSTLFQAVRDNKLALKIQIEIFERKSRVCQLPPVRTTSTAIARIMSKMYHEKLNSDAVILVQYAKDHPIHFLHTPSLLRQRAIRVHRCVLAAASPVFCSFFKHQTAENETSSIVLDQWNEDIVVAMVRFLYLGRIEFDERSKVDIVQNHEEEHSESLSADEMANESGSDVVGLDADECTMDEVKRDEVGDEERRSRQNMDTLRTPRGKREWEMRASSSTSSKGGKGWECLAAECPERVQKLFGLFQIAECYEIEELLVSCSCELRESVNLQSCVLLLLQLAKYEHLEDIKQINQYILDYTVRNIKAVKKTDSYRYVLQNKPDLVDVIIDRLAEREDTRIIV